MTHDAWLEAKGELPAAAADAMEGLLVMEGVGGVQRIDAEALPPGETNPPPSGWARLVFYLPLRRDGGADDAARLSALWREAVVSQGLNPQRCRLDIQPLAGEDWATAWRKYFHPFKIGRRLWIGPSWEPAPAAVGDVVVTIDPGMAFGTGGHETTAMVLAALSSLADEGRLPSRLLDVGAGSGILAIAACKLGASDVDAIDNDPEAVAVALRNVELNGLSKAVCRVAAAPLAAFESPYPLVLANIISSTLNALKADLVRLVAPGGRLFLSGLLAAERDEFVAAWAESGLMLAGEETRGEWLLLEYVRP